MCRVDVPINKINKNLQKECNFDFVIFFFI